MSLFYKGKEIKYIASDLDGTLLFGEGHKLDDETYDLITQCVDHGVLFVVASGRIYDNEVKVMDPIKDKVSFIANNGTEIIHEGKVLISHTIDPKDAKKAFDIANSIKDCMYFVITQSGAYTTFDYPPFYRHLIDNVHIDLQLIDDIYAIDEPIEKIALYYEKGSYLIVDQFRKEIPEFTFVTSGPTWIELMIPNINKGNALKSLLKELDINPENGIAFGDQENDVELIQTAGIGCAMKTGVDAAKDVADLVIDSPKEILKELLNK